MGLPLYIAPVESDVQSKSSPKSPAHARSAIRRLRLRSRGNGLAREQQRRALAAAAAYQDGHESFIIPSRLGTHEYEAPRPPSPPAQTNGTERARQRLREMFGNRMNTMEALDDRVVELFGERWAELHARSNPSPLLDTEGDGGPSVPPTRQQENAAQQQLMGYHLHPQHSDLHSDLPSYESSSRRSLQRIPRSPPPLRRVRSPEYLTLDRPDRPDSILDQERPYRSPRFFEHRPERSSGSRGASRFGHRYPRAYYPRTHLDGLGDRERSLSPEGDGVWDTLLTTLTPDPQPPSVGSSFASTSASAAASQGAATGSSNTSFTGPDPAEESLLEPQSGCDNSESEGEDEDDLEQNTLTRFPLRSTRSYANVAAHQSGNDDTFEVLGGIGGMQRIVRNLARREDIPDEWWAEAGLSRTLSRDGTD